MTETPRIPYAPATKHSVKAGILLLALPFAQGVAEQPVYKSIDESGQVIYSTAPPETAVESRPVEIPPGPTEEQKRAAESLAEKTKRKAESLERERAVEKEREKVTPSPPPIEEPVEARGPVEIVRVPARPHKRRPIESPDGGDHPVYDPGKRPIKPRPPRPQPKTLAEPR